MPHSLPCTPLVDDLLDRSLPVTYTRLCLTYTHSSTMHMVIEVFVGLLSHSCIPLYVHTVAVCYIAKPWLKLISASYPVP
jgi:hypothetical protein